MDQRGSGKSIPKGSIKNNTTSKLIDDIELVREYLNIESSEPKSIYNLKEIFAPTISEKIMLVDSLNYLPNKVYRDYIIFLFKYVKIQ